MRTVSLAKMVPPGRDGKRRLDWHAFTAILHTKDWHDLRTESSTPLLLSLKGLDYLNPDGLVWVLLTAEHLKQIGHAVWLELPKDERALASLRVSGFETVARQILSITNAFLLEQVPERTLVGMRCHRIAPETLGAVWKSANTFIRSSHFTNLLDLSPTGDIARTYFPYYLSTINETVKNVVMHSRPPRNEGWGYLMMGVIPKKALQLCIGDCGIGFSESLTAKNIRSRSDVAAIKNALLFRYHQRTPVNEGLFRVIQFINRIGGAIRIRSGRGEVFLHLDATASVSDESTKEVIETQLNQSLLETEFPGVQIMIDLELGRRERA